MNDYIMMAIGIAIGWITKVPFLYKWYHELKATRSWQAMDRDRRLKKYESPVKKKDEEY